MAGRPERLRALALAVLLVQVTGCLTGHLFDRARRREYVATVREAWVQGDRLVIGFEARVTDDDGHELARAPRRAAVALADLARTTMPAVEQLASWSPVGRRVAVWDGTGAPPAPPLLRVGADVDGTLRLAYEEPSDPGVVSASALTTVRTVPWAYVVAPLTLAVDAVVTPPLAVMLPAVFLFGD